MPPPALELVLPTAADANTVLRRVAARLAPLSVGTTHTHDRVLLDSFDGRLHAAGLVAERVDERGGAATLTLREPARPPRSATVAVRDRLLTGDLPPGPLRERLEPVLDLRALLPVARVISRSTAIALLNEDDKTVVRLELEHAQVLRDGFATVRLQPRLRVSALLGYDDDYERARHVLCDRLGLEPAPVAFVDEVVAAAGGRPDGISSKVAIALDPGTRADEAANAVLGRLAEIAADNLPGTLADHDTEFLHDLRVAVRRARSVLREVRGVHAPDARRHLRDELKWIQAITSPLRDLDVQLLEWEELAAAVAPERRDDLLPLRAMLMRRRATALAELRRELRSARFDAALKAWRELALTPPSRRRARDRPAAGSPIEELAADRIRAVYRRMVRDGLAIDDSSPPEHLHSMRKRGKELRYLLELFGGLFPGSVVKPMVRSLKDLQDVLGRFQDRAVQANLLEHLRDELAIEPGGPAAVLALDEAIEALHADQRAGRAAFAERFEAFAAPKRRRMIKRTFAGG